MNNNHAGGEFNLLRFSLPGGRSFGVKVSALRNIVKSSGVNEIPSQSPYFIGVIQDRGQTIPVLDTNFALGFEKSVCTQNEEQLYMIAEFESETIGFLISEARDVFQATSDMVSKDYKTSGASNLLEMIVSDGDDLLSVLDLDAIVQKVQS
ncbi:chemotaxis protein CheW [Vibrio owensii]|uniref:chemotaxis protein CheW n=1 Tax=Vibrio harveyi group TaxID=717610 RepID=UPI003CC6A2B8